MERVLDENDPDPALVLVALRIFPRKFVVLFNSLFMWVLKAGLMGPWTLFTLPTIFAANLVSNTLFAKKIFENESGELSNLSEV